MKQYQVTVNGPNGYCSISKVSASSENEAKKIRLTRVTGLTNPYIYGWSARAIEYDRPPGRKAEVD